MLELREIRVNRLYYKLNKISRKILIREHRRQDCERYLRTSKTAEQLTNRNFIWTASILGSGVWASLNSSLGVYSTDNEKEAIFILDKIFNFVYKECKFRRSMEIERSVFIKIIRDSKDEYTNQSTKSLL